MPLIEIYRAKIDPANEDRFLEIRADAGAEFQQQVPGLLQADLVRLEDGVWLDALTWSASVEEERISRGASAALKSVEMTRSSATCSGTTGGARPQQRKRMGSDSSLEQLAERAAAGDATALSRLVEEVQHPASAHAVGLRRTLETQRPGEK